MEQDEIREELKKMFEAASTRDKIYLLLVKWFSSHKNDYFKILQEEDEEEKELYIIDGWYCLKDLAAFLEENLKQDQVDKSHVPPQTENKAGEI